MLITTRQSNLSAANSNLTGAPFYVGDMETLSVSIQTSTGSASRFTIMATNEDGWQTTLGTMTSMLVPTAGWSILTVLTSQGIFGISASPGSAIEGMRWVNCFRENIQVSANSNATVTFAGHT